MNGAELLVEMLVKYEVDRIFGVPEDTKVPFCEALQLGSNEISHITARDERGAGFMADAYGRFSDKLAIVECPSSAGSMYTLPPIAGSSASSVSVILLTIDFPLPHRSDIQMTFKSIQTKLTESQFDKIC